MKHVDYITFSMWHLVDGKWRHLLQQQHDDKVVMFTDGKLEGTRY